MQKEPFAENSQEFGEFTRMEQGQYTMLLHREMSESTEGTVYFGLPDQDSYLYEYEGDLDEALNALPEVYAAVQGKTELEQVGEPNQTLTSKALVVVEQLWDYFDRTGERELEGEHDYNFQVEGDRLVVLPKEISDEVVAIDRSGEAESTFEPERYEHLLERFAVAYEQMQVAEFQQNNERDWELE